MALDLSFSLNLSAFATLAVLAWNVRASRIQNERQARAQLFDDQVGKAFSRRLGMLRELHVELLSEVHKPVLPNDTISVSDKMDGIFLGGVNMCLRSLTSTLIVTEQNKSNYFPFKENSYLNGLRGDVELGAMRELIEEAHADLVILFDEIRPRNVPSEDQVIALNQIFFKIDEDVRVGVAKYRHAIYLYVPKAPWKFWR